MTDNADDVTLAAYQLVRQEIGNAIETLEFRKTLVYPTPLGIDQAIDMLHSHREHLGTHIDQIATTIAEESGLA